MKLKDADKIKEAIKNSDDFVGGSDDIIKVIDSVPQVVISTDTDTISRQAAIKALDKRFDSIPMEQTTEILLLRRDLRELPPANNSEKPNNSDIIHCKECKWFRRWVDTDIEFCDLTESTMFSTDFCSRAEKNEVTE